MFKHLIFIVLILVSEVHAATAEGGKPSFQANLVVPLTVKKMVSPMQDPESASTISGLAICIEQTPVASMLVTSWVYFEHAVALNIWLNPSKAVTAQWGVKDVELGLATIVLSKKVAPDFECIPIQKGKWDLRSDLFLTTFKPGGDLWYRSDQPKKRFIYDTVPLFGVSGAEYPLDQYAYAGKILAGSMIIDAKGHWVGLVVRTLPPNHINSLIATLPVIEQFLAGQRGIIAPEIIQSKIKPKTWGAKDVQRLKEP